MQLDLNKSRDNSYQQLVEISKRSKRDRKRRRFLLFMTFFMIFITTVMTIAGFAVIPVSRGNFVFLTGMTLMGYLTAFLCYDSYLEEKGGKRL
jgi:NADH:ubiquinone oxidoreductase subunit 3 (subunit A)